MPGKAGGITTFILTLGFGALVGLVPLADTIAQDDAPSEQQTGVQPIPEAGFEIRNCSEWDLNVRVGLTEFDMTDQKTLVPGGSAADGSYTCTEAACVVVYGRTESHCSWSAPNMAPGAYVLRHVHTRMIDQCSYATETLGGGGSQFYYLSLEPGAQC